LKNVPAGNVSYIVATRLMLVGFFAVLVFFVWKAWKNKKIRSS
jgi:hypothetical protein